MKLCKKLKKNSCKKKMVWSCQGLNSRPLSHQPKHLPTEPRLWLVIHTLPFNYILKLIFEISEPKNAPRTQLQLIFKILQNCVVLIDQRVYLTRFWTRNMMMTFNFIYFCCKMINSLMNTKNPNMTNLCEIVYDYDMMQLIEG